MFWRNWLGKRCRCSPTKGLKGGFTGMSSDLDDGNRNSSIVMWCMKCDVDFSMPAFLVWDPFMSMTPAEEFGSMMNRGGKETNTNWKQFQISVEERVHALLILYSTICHNVNLFRMRHQSFQMSSLIHSKWLSVVIPEQLEPEFPYLCISKKEQTTEPIIFVAVKLLSTIHHTGSNSSPRFHRHLYTGMALLPTRGKPLQSSLVLGKNEKSLALFVIFEKKLQKNLGLFFGFLRQILGTSSVWTGGTDILCSAGT